jgi:hypothetical protein
MKLKDMHHCIMVGPMFLLCYAFHHSDDFGVRNLNAKLFLFIGHDLVLLNGLVIGEFPNTCPYAHYFLSAGNVRPYSSNKPAAPYPHPKIH